MPPSQQAIKYKQAQSNTKQHVGGIPGNLANLEVGVRAFKMREENQEPIAIW